MRINKIVFIAVLYIVAMVVLAFVPLLVIGQKNSFVGLIEVQNTGTIVTDNTSIPSPTSTSPSINIIQILTVVSLVVTIAIGLLKISGRNFYIGSKKKFPYVVILDILKKLGRI